MRRCRVHLSMLVVMAMFVISVSPTAVRAVDTLDTRFLASPAITEGKIAFVYADDIWVAAADGTGARRLTAHPGQERSPYFAPDGKHIAFTASYDGNVDVYVMPVDGGEPNRLTWHPGDDVVRGFTADGKILFTSQRAVFSRRHSQFFTIGVHGGVPQAIPVPTGDMGAISADGSYLAYTPLGERFRQWKNYRGGTASRIWVLKLADLSHEQIPKPSEGCNDTQPMWMGETVYFLSDRDGEFNLYSYDLKSKNVVRRTRHEGFPVESASAGAGRIIYEQAGYLHLFNPGTNECTRLKVGVAADLAETRPRYVTNVKSIRSAKLSPTGKRAVLEYRGEIVTVPAKKGDPRNLTETPGVHERSPVWSPDGKSIAWFSDASGEYALQVRRQDGQGEGRIYTIKGAGFYDRPVWSPDSKKIAFVDNSRTLLWIDLASGVVRRVAAEPVYGPIDILSASWSPDSRWLAYTLSNKVGFQTLSLYALDQDRSFPLTDGLAEAGEPVFDASGKYLFFVASTNAGPVKNWFDQSFTDMPLTMSVYLVTLQKSTPNPLLKESDEETSETADKGKEDSKPQDQGDSSSPKNEDLKAAEKKSAELSKPPGAASSGKSADTKESAAKASKPVVVDLEGISGRIVSLPIEEGLILGMTQGAEGEIYYLRHSDVRPARGEESTKKPSLRRFDLKKREEETLADGIDSFHLSADHKKILYRAAEVIGIVDAGKFNKGDGALAAVSAISIRIDPRAEWAEMFREAWRINRDFFYATNMHGADWNAVRSKYEPLLPHLASRGDLDRVLRAMLSELAVGHSYLGGGERLYEPKVVPVGLLGADYEVAENRFRFKTIYGGAFWDPSLRAAADSPGSGRQSRRLLAGRQRQAGNGRC